MKRQFKEISFILGKGVRDKKMITSILAKMHILNIGNDFFYNIVEDLV